jgi:hypothetical protein
MLFIILFLLGHSNNKHRLWLDVVSKRHKSNDVKFRLSSYFELGRNFLQRVLSHICHLLVEFVNICHQVRDDIVRDFERVSFNNTINREWTRAWHSYLGL